MKIAEEKRQRKWTSKTRTGCKTCKYETSRQVTTDIPSNNLTEVEKPPPSLIHKKYPTNAPTVRRVKCGEERPGCIQCSNTGRKCDGYDLPISTWIITKKPPQESKSTTVIRLSPVSNAFQGQELRSLGFFLEKTTAQIGSSFSQNLWSNIIPLLAQSEASIKHAVVALSGFHEHFSYENDSKYALVGSGLKHYNYAIRDLVSQSHKPSPVIGLLSCVLFFAIELLQGKLGSALQLFRTGRRIIHEIRAKSGSISHLEPYQELFVTLKAAYIRLEYHVSAFCSPIDESLPFDTCYGISEGADQSTSDSSIYTRSNSIAMFTSIGQATEELRQIAHSFVNNTFSHITGNLSWKEILRNWCTAFEEFKKTLPEPVSTQDRWTIAGLEIWWRQVELSILALADPINCLNPLWFDQHERRMEEIIDYIEIQCGILSAKSMARDTKSETMKLPSSPSPPLSLTEQLSPSFCLETGFVTHLITIVHRCRDPTIRRRALSVLKSCNRQEGFFRRDIVVQSCERVIEIEEHDLADVTSSADVPAENRIVSVRLQLSPDATKLDLRCLIGEDWIVDSYDLVNNA